MTLAWIKILVKWLVLPPMGPLLLALAGLAIVRRKPRQGRRLLAVGVLSLTLLSIPAVGALLVRCLDQSPPLDTSNVSGAQAIVILGGGVRLHAPEYGGVTLSSITLERVRYGARLARATDLPILVAGGAVRGAPPEALLMRNALVKELAVPVRWMETRSRDTHENAVNSAEMLKADGVQRVILVGHSFDFPRTRAEFDAVGIETIAAPIGMPPPVPTALGDYLPSVTGLRLSYYASYEILANVLFLLSH